MLQPSDISSRRERDAQASRVLLVGSSDFCSSSADAIGLGDARVVGRAHTADDAVEAARSLVPDFAVLEPGMLHVAPRLSEWTSVIVVSAGHDADEPEPSRAMRTETACSGLLAIVLGLARMVSPSWPDASIR